MSTWMDDLRRRDPALAADYAVTGNQSRWALRNMVRALSSMEWMNTEEDKLRLAAARRILSRNTGEPK
jgi:hypothetical protein